MRRYLAAIILSFSVCLAQGMDVGRTTLNMKYGLVVCDTLPLMGWQLNSSSPHDMQTAWRVQIFDRDSGKSKERKIFPGYVIVKMIVTNESWYLVRNTQGVTGFVGQGSEPIPLSDEEVRRMGIEKTVIVMDIHPGDSVKVITGPFKGFVASVEEVNADKQTIKAKVDMFGRSTSVELEYDQVDKL